MLPCEIIRVILTSCISEKKTKRLTPVIDFFYQGIIESRKRACGNGVAQRLERYDHVELAIEKLPLGKIHSRDLFVLIRRALGLLGIVGITAAFVTTDGLFHVDGLSIVFKYAPKKMLIIRAHFIFRSEKTF